LRRFRFVHAADLHLDSPFKGALALPEPLAAQVRMSTYAALDRLVDLAIREGARFVLFCGDVYDAPDRSLGAQFRFRDALARLGERGIAAFVVHGNHDPLSGYRARLDWPDNAVFFGAEEAGAVPLADERGDVYACVHGISYRRAAEREDLSARFAVRDRGVFNIAMLHANVDGRPGHDNYAPCRLDDLKRAGFDYWALGHIHTPAVLHREPWIVYPGNPQGRHMKESGPRGVMLVEVEGGRVARAEFRETDVIRWERRVVDITGLEDEQALVDRMLAALFEGESERAGAPLDAGGRPDAGGPPADSGAQSDERSRIVRLELVGRGPLHGAVLASEERTGELLAELRSVAFARWEQAGAAFHWPESLHVRTGPTWDRDALRSGEGFLAELLALSEELLADASRREAFVRQALAALYGNYRLGRVVGAPTEEELADWLGWAETRALMLLTEGGDE
jgi:DNA repair exonuclease SbcCD nuclease subunit